MVVEVLNSVSQEVSMVRCQPVIWVEVVLWGQQFQKRSLYTLLSSAIIHHFIHIFHYFLMLFQVLKQFDFITGGVFQWMLESFEFGLCIVWDKLNILLNILR